MERRSPFADGLEAASASGLVFTNHCSEKYGSTTVRQR
jgi:hypothetical protein